MDISDNDKTALIDGSATIPFKINIVENGETIKTLDEHSIVNLDIEDFRYVDTDSLVVGQFVAKKVTGELDQLYSEFNLENTEIELQMGISYNDNTTYYSLGNYLITKPETNDVKDKTSFEGLDYTKKFNKPFDSGALQYPCTALELAKYCCDKCGVELATTEFTNNDFVINNNQYNSDDTYRKVMQDIGKLAYSWVRIGNDNKCYIDFSVPTTTSDNISNFNKIDGDHYYDLTKQEKVYGPVNRVVIGMTNIEGENITIEDSESIAANGACELKVLDNNLTYTPELRQQVSEGGKRLFGLKFLPLSITTTGHPWLTGQEIIQITTPSNEIIETIPFDRTLTYSGHIKSKLVSKAETTTETEYKNLGNIETDIKQTRYIVDKANQTITQLVKDVYDDNGVIHDNFTQIEQNLTNIVTNVQNSGGGNQIKNSVMFAYDEQGNPNDWNVTGGGTLTISSSVEAMQNGSLSGHVFVLNDKTVKQRVNVKIHNNSDKDLTYYTFSTKIKKDTTGSCYVKLSNSNEEHIIELKSGESSFYGDYEINSLLPKDTYYDIEFYGSADSNATFTDNMLSIGEYKTQWTQASGEIMNTQVNISVDGVVVKSSIYEGDYTIMSPLEFAGYSKINGTLTKVFSLNKDTTLVKKLESEDEIKMNPIKIVPVTTGDLQGWAFVPTEGE